VHAEDSEAGEVVCGGERVEVGVDFASAAHPGPPATVLAAHQVTEFAFHLGSGRPVVHDPLGVFGLPAGISEALLEPAHRDRATSGGLGALRPQRTIGWEGYDFPP
jgi:hypothetical protein